MVNKSANEIVSFIEGWIYSISSSIPEIDNADPILRTLKDIVAYATAGESMFPGSRVSYSGEPKIDTHTNDIYYARDYSDRIYSAVAERFNIDDDYKIGCNDVADVVMNAILDALNNKSYSNCDNVEKATASMKYDSYKDQNKNGTSILHD